MMKEPAWAMKFLVMLQMPKFEGASGRGDSTAGWSRAPELVGRVIAANTLVLAECGHRNYCMGVESVGSVRDDQVKETQICAVGNQLQGCSKERSSQVFIRSMIVEK